MSPCVTEKYVSKLRKAELSFGRGWTYQLPDPTMVTLCFFECPPKFAMLPNVVVE